MLYMDTCDKDEMYSDKKKKLKHKVPNDYHGEGGFWRLN